jgi:hypothetical protein
VNHWFARRSVPDFIDRLMTGQYKLQLPASFTGTTSLKHRLKLRSARMAYDCAQAFGKAVELTPYGRLSP